MIFLCKCKLLIVSEEFIDEKATKEKKTVVKAKPDVTHDKMTFLEYVEKMHKLSLMKRRDIVEHRKHYCDYIKDNIEKGGKS
jgi:hypothetical protein